MINKLLLLPSSIYLLKVVRNIFALGFRNGGSSDFGFCEFHLLLIAIFLSNCFGSLSPSSIIKRSFEFWNTFLKLFWQIGGWQAAKCVLEGFRSLYIKDNFFVESRAFVYNCLLKPALSQWISVVNLIVGWCKFASSQKVTMSGLKKVFSLDFGFQYMTWKCWQRKLLSLCPFRYGGFVGRAFHWTGKN